MCHSVMIPIPKRRIKKTSRKSFTREKLSPLKGKVISPILADDYKFSFQVRKVEEERKKLNHKNPASQQSQNLFQFRKVVFHFLAVLISKWSIVRLCLFPSLPLESGKEARKRKNGFELIANWHSSAPTFLIFNWFHDCDISHFN